MMLSDNGFFVILIGIPAAAIGCLSYQIMTTHRVCVTEKIIKVGGCTSTGRCGVLTETGRQDSAYNPVEGGHERFCRLEKN